jgi:hypothetical protein
VGPVSEEEIIETVRQKRKKRDAIVGDDVDVESTQMMDKHRLFYALHILKQEWNKANATATIRSLVRKLQAEILRVTMFGGSDQPIVTFFPLQPMGKTKQGTVDEEMGLEKSQAHEEKEKEQVPEEGEKEGRSSPAGSVDKDADDEESKLIENEVDLSDPIGKVRSSAESEEKPESPPPLPRPSKKYRRFRVVKRSLYDLVNSTSTVSTSPTESKTISHHHTPHQTWKSRIVLSNSRKK